MLKLTPQTLNVKKYALKRHKALDFSSRSLLSYSPLSEYTYFFPLDVQLKRSTSFSHTYLNLTFKLTLLVLF